MKITRKILVILLAMIITTATLPFGGLVGHAAEIVKNGKCGTNVTYTLDNEGTLTLSGYGDTFNFHSDSEGSVNPFSSQSIVRIEIEEGITSLGEAIFAFCSDLMTVSIPESIRVIDGGAFSCCKKLTSIVIPDSVMTIGDSAFSYCSNLASVEIGNNVRNICDYAFKECSNLTTIKIPSSVVFIGPGVFSGCTSLFKLEVDEDNPYYLIDGNCIVKKGTNALIAGCKSSIIPDGVTSIGDYAFSNCSGLTSIKIPDGVTSIGAGAFSGCTGLTTIMIPDGVTSIGDMAYYSCDGLTSVDIPNSVTKMSKNAFAYCRALTRITLPESTVDIDLHGCSSLISLTLPENVISVNLNGCSSLTALTLPENIDSVFLSDCSSLTSLTIPKSVTNFSAGGSGLTSVRISYGVTTIKETAFRDCSQLSKIEIPDSVVNIGSRAFENTKWYNEQLDGLVYAGKVAYKYKGEMPDGTKIELKDDTKGIASEAFKDCSGMVSITLPDGLEFIGWSAFYGCAKLNAITIPEGLTSINRGAFYQCTGLMSIVIPENITLIEDFAFDYCYNLSSILFSDNVEYIGESALSNTLWYENQPDGLIYAGKVAYSYKGVMPSNTVITLANDTKGIGYSAFSGYTNLSSITITDQVTNIGKFAFAGCTGLTSLVLPDSVKRIGYQAFSNCSGLESIVLSSNLTTIDSLLFCDCTALTSVKIPNGVTDIQANAFAGCSGLTSIGVPDSVNNIERFAFSGCIGLTDIRIPESVTIINSGVFYGCQCLTSIQIPAGVTVLSEEAFASCSGLKTIEIPVGVQEIQKAAFIDCNNLKDIYYNGSEKEWSNITISSGNESLTGAAIHYGSTDSVFRVLYNPNGGKNAPDAQTKAEGAALTLSTQKPTKSFKLTYDANGGTVSPASKTVKCTFNNWNTKADGSGATYKPGASYNKDADLTLYAQWTNPTVGNLPTPTRSGYTFDGWYTEAVGGKKIENSEIITQSITLYSHWTSISMRYLDNTDIYSFGNSSDHFGVDYYLSNQDFLILADYIKKIYVNDPDVAKSIINEIQKQRLEEWGGSCYGMAVTTILDKQHAIGFNENFDPDAQTMSEVDSPSKNSKVKSAINYYFMSQMIPYLRSYKCKAYDKYKADWNAGLKQLVSMSQDGKPMLFCYFFTYYFETYGHAIVIKGYEKAPDGGHNIIAYDNRYPDKDVIIHVDADFSECVINEKENAEYIEFIEDMSGFNAIDIDGSDNRYKITDADTESDNPFMQSAQNSIDPNNTATVISVLAKGKIVIENAEKETLTIENGEISGTMDVADKHFLAAMTEAGENDLKMQLTVAPSDSFSFESDNDEMDVSIQSAGLYGAVKTNGADYIVISKEDGVYALGDDFLYEIYLSVNNNICDMISVEGDADNDVKLELIGNKIKATGVDTKDGIVTVFSDIVNSDTYNYKSGYRSFVISSANSGKPGDVNILGSSQENGIYDINILESDNPSDPSASTTTEAPTTTEPPTDPVSAKDIESKDPEKAVVNADKKQVTVLPGVTADELKDLLGGGVTITDADGKVLDAGKKVGTGALVKTADGAEFTVIVPGDTDGDGSVKAVDARAALRAASRIEPLSGAFEAAADISGDAKVQASDARSILRIAAKLDSSSLKKIPDVA